jgi:hypothetical protein
MLRPHNPDVPVGRAFTLDLLLSAQIRLDLRAD